MKEIKLYSLFTKEELEKEIVGGYVQERTHPEFPNYKILDYTTKTQFENNWNDVTINCRGLIYNTDTNTIVARGPKKFFNYEQNKNEFLKEVLEHSIHNFVKSIKEDGSCGILYPTPSHDSLRFSTRGSFESEQSKVANDMFKPTEEQYIFLRKCIIENKTPIFEIIYPENRIVVDYGNEKDLKFVCLIDNETGKIIFDNLYHDLCDLFNTSKAYRFQPICFESSCEIDSYMELFKETFPDNFEGYVITNTKTGTSFKLKSKEYCRIHSIISNLSSIAIWKNLMSGFDIESILNNVPDEFYNWSKKKEAELVNAYNSIKNLTIEHFNNIKRTLDNVTDKEVAIEIQKLPKNISNLVFTYWRKGDHEQLRNQIFNLIKPKYEIPKYLND